MAAFLHGDESSVRLGSAIGLPTVITRPEGMTDAEWMRLMSLSISAKVFRDFMTETTKLAESVHKVDEIEATLAAVRAFAERIVSGKATPAEGELTRRGVAQEVLKFLENV